MAKVAGEISGTCQLQDPRTESSNSQDPIFGTSHGLPRKADSIKKTRYHEKPAMVTPHGVPPCVS